MKHWHHIVPRHMGGSDHPSNLVLLSVEEHAEAHRLLFEKHGRWEDKLAWKALSGQITMSEASKEAWMRGSYKGGFGAKPNSVPSHFRLYYHCVGCRKEVKPSAKGHKLCFQKFFGLPKTPNDGLFSKERGQKMSQKNNSLSECPHCGKEGQYRAMKRWHFDNCRKKATD